MTDTSPTTRLNTNPNTSSPVGAAAPGEAPALASVGSRPEAAGGTAESPIAESPSGEPRTAGPRTAVTSTAAARSAEAPPSFVKLAMRNMVRKGRQSLLHFGLTAVGFIGFILLVAWFGRPTLPQ